MTPPNSLIHCLLLKNFTPLLTFTQKELYVIYHCLNSTDQTIWLTILSEEPARQRQRTSESQREIKIHFNFFTNAPALFVHNSSVGVISKLSINVQLHVKPKPCRLWTNDAVLLSWWRSQSFVLDVSPIAWKDTTEIHSKSNSTAMQMNVDITSHLVLEEFGKKHRVHTEIYFDWRLWEDGQSEGSLRHWNWN